MLSILTFVLRVPNVESGSIASQKDLGMFVGNGEQLQSCFAWTPHALLPAFYCIDTHVDDAGEARLANLE